jgi:hypothetical protein
MLVELRIPATAGKHFSHHAAAGGGATDHRACAAQRTNDLLIGPGEHAMHLAYGLAAGIEAISWHQLGIRMLFGVTYTTADRWDLLVRGDDNDGYSYATLSLHYYFTFRR